ncbi:hypothetical protein EAI_02720 [Harpegnathos saltator]|uniref:Uncharacterized protein n=1 Tax=Harpegnathos saltator TaxID=610380 RepID=E2BSV3_HARSA|nr:hypothetical protein EAI_02720 [Harpegnathos saltator]
MFSRSAQRERDARARLRQFYRDLHEATAFPDRGDDPSAQTTISRDSLLNEDNIESKRSRRTAAKSARIDQYRDTLILLRFTHKRSIESILSESEDSLTALASKTSMVAQDDKSSEKKDTTDDTESNDTISDNDDKAYVNPIARLEPLTVVPKDLSNYALSPENAPYRGKSTVLHDNWLSSE